MQILSLLENNQDVIDTLTTNIQDEIREEVDIPKTIKKIFGHIDLFAQLQYIDGQTVKHLSGSIFEFKISIPQSKHLLRIVFHRQRDQIILLTGSLIKPEAYGDKHTTEVTDERYEEEIIKAQAIADDYHGPQKHHYIPLLVHKMK